MSEEKETCHAEPQFVENTGSSASAPSRKKEILPFVAPSFGRHCGHFHLYCHVVHTLFYMVQVTGGCHGWSNSATGQH
jgi:hypothetical protein